MFTGCLVPGILLGVAQMIVVAIMAKKYGFPKSDVHYSKKEALQKTYKSAEKDIQALNRKLDNLNQYLDRTPGQEQTTNRKPEKDFTSL